MKTSNGGQWGASLGDKASVSEAAGVQEGGPRGPECPCHGWGRKGGGESVLAGGGRGSSSRGKDGERPQPGAGSRTHSEPDGGRVLGLTRPPGPRTLRLAGPLLRGSGCLRAGAAHKGVGAGHEQPPSPGTWGHPPPQGGRAVVVGAGVLPTGSWGGGPHRGA